MPITIVSFGSVHGPVPDNADLVIQVGHRFRDPHVSPDMRQMTGLDLLVRDNVLAQLGAQLTVQTVAAAAVDLAAIHGDTTVAYGCVGGRHRSVALAVATASMLRQMGTIVAVVHRDIDKPVTRRAVQS